jgi:DNA-binding GntR family transcriptional regulator
MIVRWEYRPGQRLIDSELAQQYGVSRSLIRNAITLLVNEGMVEVSHRRFYVARFSQKERVMENFSMILGDDTAGDETADSLAIPLPPMKENTR